MPSERICRGLVQYYDASSHRLAGFVDVPGGTPWLKSQNTCSRRRLLDALL